MVYVIEQCHEYGGCTVLGASYDYVEALKFYNEVKHRAIYEEDMVKLTEWTGVTSSKMILMERGDEQY